MDNNATISQKLLPAPRLRAIDCRPSSSTLSRLVRGGFSDAEWATLSARRDFLARVELIASVDDAEVVIRYGAELIEGSLPRPDFLQPTV